MRAAALFTPEATPACRLGAAPSTVTVSGATVADSPRPKTPTPGSTSTTYDALWPMRLISSTPPAHSSGPSVIGSRGPMRPASAPARGDSSSIAAVTGSSAVPPERGEAGHHLQVHHQQEEHAVIDHPAGAEVQWDWVELPDPPAHWNAGAQAHLLVGALPFSGKWRGVLCASEDLPHLIDGLHQVSGRLGGLPRGWRFDRMATVASPNTGKVTASFAAVAKHYGVHVHLCPPRHSNRKGTVEKANHSAAQRWWRTLPDELTVTQAQASLDAFCARTGDARKAQARRRGHDRRGPGRT